MADNKLLTNVSFASKVVMITGASNGIGKEAAIYFAKLGANLSISGRNADNLKDTFEKCRENFANPDEQKIIQQICDVTKEEEVERMVGQTIDEFKQLDVVVNNAGILEFGSIENTSLEQYDRVMNTNVRSIYHLTMLAVPHLIKTKGNIVNVSSVNGIRSFANVLAYCVSKGALDQFTRCTAIELGAKGVRVNAVNPGVITTGIHKRSGLNEEEYANFLEHSKSTHALGRAGESWEVAASIAFLASDMAQFITGATLPVDGGRHALCPR